MAPLFFQYTLCYILIILEIEIVMPGPCRAVAEDNCRDTVVALAHDKISKSRYLIYHRLLRLF